MSRSRRNASATMVMGTFLLGAALAQVAPADPPFPPAPPSASSGPASAVPEELPLDIFINGQALGPTIVLRVGGQFLASTADFSRWRLHLPPGPTLTYQGETYAPLSALGSVPPRFDERALTLSLEVPVSSFDESVLTLDSTSANPMPRDFSVAVNYGLGAAYSADWSADATADMTVSTPFGVGRGTIAAALDSGSATVVRGQTSWTVDLRAAPSSIRVGDGISQGGGWGVPVLYGGVQWATNFGLWPEMATAPLLTVEGDTVVPGVASVYVDNRLVLTRDLPVGPFRITGIPASVSAGIVRVVVRDDQGGMHEVLRPFLSDASLLRPGLGSFALDAGFRREDYGLSSFSYGAPFVSGLYRRGLSDSVTAELRAEADAQQYAAGGSLTWAWAGVGTVRATAVGSSGAAGPGALGSLGLSGEQGPWAYGGAVTARTPGFRQLGADGEQNPIQASLGLSRTFGRVGGDLGVSYSATRQPDGTATSTVSGTYSREIRGTNVSVGLSQQLGPQPRTIFTLGVTAHLNADTTLSADTDVQGARVSVNRQLTTNHPGYGASVSYGGGQFSGSAQAAVQTPYGTASAAGALASGAGSVAATFSGGAVLIGGGVFPGQAIQDAYALVRVGFPGVRVYRGGQLMGRTGAGGTLLVPNLTPYVRNRVSIDARDLPLNAKIPVAELTVVPSGGSGTVITFKPRIERAALLRLVQTDGTPVPVGATVRVDDDAAEYPVIEIGETYVENLSARSRLRATWEGGACETMVTYPETQDPFADLGVVTCE